MRFIGQSGGTADTQSSGGCALYERVGSNPTFGTKNCLKDILGPGKYEFTSVSLDCKESLAFFTMKVLLSTDRKKV